MPPGSASCLTRECYLSFPRNQSNPSVDSNARLNANRNLRIRKVMAYVAEKLELHQTSRAPSISGASQAAETDTQPSSPSQATAGAADASLPAVKLNGPTPGHSRAASETSVASQSTHSSSVPTQQGQQTTLGLDPERDIEVLCGDVVLGGRMTLAMVRTHYWKSGGDVVLSYRRKRAPE